MARLPRKAVPVRVKCLVAARQLGWKYPEDLVALHKGKLGALLKTLLSQLSAKLGCTVAQLRLDHNPALGIREKIKDKAGKIIGYIPHEHSPDDLIYRDEHAHHIKTNVRGDGAQFSDTVLMKRERRREKRMHNSTHKSPTVRAKKSTWATANGLRDKNGWPKGRKIKSRGFERRS